MLSIRQFNGKMNLDVAPYRVPSGDFIDALNITREAGANQDRVVSNISGNEKVVYTLPSGENKCIGSKEDKVKNRIYYFVWNSENSHSILYYNRITGTIVKVIQNILDTNNVDVLQFNPSYRINHVDLIYRDEGDLLFWTDGYTSPKKINIDHILNNEYVDIKLQFIEVAKRPPLTPPVGVYGNDTTRAANSLRRKLFMFTYRFGYDDYEKSTFASYSKIPLPIGVYGSDNDIDSNKNNFITITVQTGDENVRTIEIAARVNIGSAWNDFVLIASLNKDDLGILDNTTYNFLFYNDSVYPPIDAVESGQLFDWVPQIAYTQCSPNGNVIDYAAIREGYDNIETSQLDVMITAENVTNTPPDADPPAITYVQTTAQDYDFTVSGSVPTGTYYAVEMTVYNPSPTFILLAEYTSLPGDTINDVAIAMEAYIHLHWPMYEKFPVVGSVFRTQSFPLAGSAVSRITVVAGAGGGGTTISTEKTWLWDANYVFGIVYVDEQNRDMPGVTTYANPNITDNDFVVTTPAFSLDVGDVQTPVITSKINHQPPDGAVKYYWVRRRQTYGTFLFYETCDFQEVDGYYYFCLGNIAAYKSKNSQFVYPTIPISSDSRVKVMAGITPGGASAYDGNIWTQDYQILGVETRLMTSGTSPANDQPFIKVKKPISAPTPAYEANMLVMIYTPSVNPTTLADSVYYEWGEAYDIYDAYEVNYTDLVGTFQIGEIIDGNSNTAIVRNDSGTSLIVSDLSNEGFTPGATITGRSSGATATFISQGFIGRFHGGSDQNQTSTQPAITVWEEGDVYFHERSMYYGLNFDDAHIDTLPIMDAGYSDFFDSSVNDNGRGQAVEVNAKKTYYPTLNRFSGEYQQSTNINNTNRFYFDNMDEYDRSFGDIRKLFIEGRYMYVYQKFDVGVVPVLSQIIRDTTGNPLEANSDILLNKIAYPYKGKFGIGDLPESFAYGKSAKYFIDSSKGVLCEHGDQGIVPISIVFEANDFFVTNVAPYRKDLNNGFAPVGEVYSGDATIYGAFDSFNNKYIAAFEAINRYTEAGELTYSKEPVTISFSEKRDSKGFESFYSFHPENMVCLDNLLVSFKDGELWKHDSDTYANFYGVQYDASIKAVFNDNPEEKKTWEALAETSNVIWECPIIETQVNSYGTSPQQSKLIARNFGYLEGKYGASFRRATNSRGGWNNGDVLKGNYIIIQFKVTDASAFVFLNTASVKFIDSPLTTK